MTFLGIRDLNIHRTCYSCAQTLNEPYFLYCSPDPPDMSAITYYRVHKNDDCIVVFKAKCRLLNL